MSALVTRNRRPGRKCHTLSVENSIHRLPVGVYTDVANPSLAKRIETIDFVNKFRREGKRIHLLEHTVRVGPVSGVYVATLSLTIKLKRLINTELEARDSRYTLGVGCCIFLLDPDDGSVVGVPAEGRDGRECTCTGERACTPRTKRCVQ